MICIPVPMEKFACEKDGYSVLLVEDVDLAMSVLAVSSMHDS